MIDKLIVVTVVMSLSAGLNICRKNRAWDPLGGIAYGFLCQHLYAY